MNPPEYPDLLEEIVVALVGLPIAFTLQNIVQTIQDCASWNSTTYFHLILTTSFCITCYFLYASALQFQIRKLSINSNRHAFIAIICLVITISGLIVSGSVYKPDNVFFSVNYAILSIIGVSLAYFHILLNEPEFITTVRNYQILAIIIFVIFFGTVVFSSIVSI